MRLLRGVDVAGVSPDVARDIARACSHDWVFAERVAPEAHLELDATRAALTSLEAADFVVRQATTWEGSPDWYWTTTVAGNALAMASFARPISRRKAESLVAGVLERAAAYNADAGKPFLVDKITVFGSYLSPEILQLGDIDLSVQLSERSPGSGYGEGALAYANQSGRRFGSIVEHLGWTQTEVLQVLRNRSTYLSIGQEDVAALTSSWEVIFTRHSQEDGRSPGVAAL